MSKNSLNASKLKQELCAEAALKNWEETEQFNRERLFNESDSVELVRRIKFNEHMFHEHINECCDAEYSLTSWTFFAMHCSQSATVRCLRQIIYKTFYHN